MVSAADVTACLVTRGDQPAMMEAVFESLIFDRVVVWDNSIEPDWKCAGRYMAAATALTPFVYFQDDDVVVPADTQRELVARYAFEPVLANYGHGDDPDGYDDLPLVCGGAIANRFEALRAMARYGANHPLDTDFMYEADFAVGVLYPSFEHVFLPFHINLEVAQHPSRLCNQPWQKATKLKVTERARAIRDRAMVAA